MSFLFDAPCELVRESWLMLLPYFKFSFVF